MPAHQQKKLMKMGAQSIFKLADGHDGEERQRGDVGLTVAFVCQDTRIQ